MKNTDITIPVTVASYEELSASDRELVDKARAATFRSYAPYSKFNVGAAIRLDNGQTASGSNQENVAYPSGTCAERTTCYWAHSTYPDAKFEAIAIAARNGDSTTMTEAPIAPCGACRQALLEYETLAGHDVRVLLTGADKIYILPSIKSLLPFAFTEF